MNIGLLTYSISERSGSRAPIRFAQYFKKRGHHVTLYAFDYALDENLYQHLREEGLQTVIYKVNKNSLVPFPLRGFFSIIKATVDLRRADHDVISFHATLPLLIAARLCGKRILTTYYGMELSYMHIRNEAGLPLDASLIIKISSKLGDYILIWMQRLVFALSHEVVAISKYLAKDAELNFNSKFDVIYLGAESDFVRKGKQSSPDSNYLLSVSRIVPYKGFDFLINQFNTLSQEFPKLELKIVGSIANPAYLEELKGQANSKVMIETGLSDDQLARMYQNCSVYVVCDLWAPWSLTLLEASFFGKPLLGLDKGSINEIISDNENGYLAKTPVHLREGIIKLMTDPVLRKKLGENAKEKVGRFTWEKTIEKYEKKIMEML